VDSRCNFLRHIYPQLSGRHNHARCRCITTSRAVRRAASPQLRHAPVVQSLSLHECCGATRRPLEVTAGRRTHQPSPTLSLQEREVLRQDFLVLFDLIFADMAVCLGLRFSVCSSHNTLTCIAGCLESFVRSSLGLPPGVGRRSARFLLRLHPVGFSRVLVLDLDGFIACQRRAFASCQAAHRPRGGGRAEGDHPAGSAGSTRSPVGGPGGCRTRHLGGHNGRRRIDKRKARPRGTGRVLLSGRNQRRWRRATRPPSSRSERPAGPGMPVATTISISALSGVVS
jgi:hypothetical protein